MKGAEKTEKPVNKEDTKPAVSTESAGAAKKHGGGSNTEASAGAAEKKKDGSKAEVSAGAANKKEVGRKTEASAEAAEKMEDGSKTKVSAGAAEKKKDGSKAEVTVKAKRKLPKKEPTQKGGKKGKKGKKNKTAKKISGTESPSEKPATHGTAAETGTTKTDAGATPPVNVNAMLNRASTMQRMNTSELQSLVPPQAAAAEEKELTPEVSKTQKKKFHARYMRFFRSVFESAKLNSACMM